MWASFFFSLPVFWQGRSSYFFSRGRRGPWSYGSWIYNTIYAISAYHHWCYEFQSQSGRGVQHYVIKFVSDLRQVCGFLRVLRFPPSIKLIATIWLFSFESFKAYHSTFPSPHEVCIHFPTFPPTFRSATTPLAIVSEKICSHNMN